MSRIAPVHVFVMHSELSKPVHDKADQAILIVGDIHHLEELAHELARLLHFLQRQDMALADDGLADFTLLAEHVRQLRVIRLNRRSRILDGHALIDDQLGSHRGNVDFAPAIRNGAVAALDVSHRRGELPVVLNLKVLIHPVSRFLIALHTVGQHVVCRAVEHRENVGIGFRIPCNEAEVAVHMGNQVLQRLVDAALCIAALEGQLFAIREEGALDDGAAQLFDGGELILAGFVLLIADDVLHRLGQLGDIALLDVLANLHRAFERFIIRRIRQHDSRFPALGLAHQPEVGFHRCIRGDSQEAQAHTAGEHADSGAVHHLVESEVVLAVAVLLCRVDVGKDHVTDALHDGGGIDRRVPDFALDVLLLVGEEVVGVACPGDVVLAHQPVEGRRYSGAHGDLVRAQVIRHQDDDVVQIGLHIVDITDEVEELEHIHVLRFNAEAAVRSPLAALDDAADGAVQEGMNRVVETEEWHKRVLIARLDLLSSFLKAGEHRTLAAGEVLAGVAVLAQLGEDLLHDDELIGDKREIHRKLAGTGIALDVQNGIGEAE